MWEKPRDLEPPENCDRALYQRVARRKAREKVEQERAERATWTGIGAAQHRQLPSSPTRGDAEDKELLQDDEEDALPAARDPTTALEVQELLHDERVRTVYASLQGGMPGSPTSPSSPSSRGRPALPSPDGKDVEKALLQEKGLHQARLYRALEALGYKEPDPGLIKASLKTLVRYEASKDGLMILALDEFCAVVWTFDLKRQDYLREAFKALDRDGSGSISTREFRHLLWDRGFTVTEAVVEEIFSEVDGNKSGQVELPEFEEALRIVHARHGFTKHEAASLMSIYDRYDSNQSGQMEANELASALGWFGTPTTIREAEKIIERFDQQGDGALRRCEFLMVMRHFLEEEMSHTRMLFGECDAESKGSLTQKQLTQLLMKLGYTIPLDVLQEGIKELGPTKNTMGLVFEDVYKLISTIRERNGFSKSEVSELLALYKQFDNRGTGELREFELAHALNFLGYPLSAARRRKLWCDVDVDKTNSIDPSEFLALLRLLREEETSAAKKLVHNSAGQGQPREKDIKAMLHRLGYQAQFEVLNQALKQLMDSIGPGGTELLGVLSFLRTIREGQVVSLRQSAGLEENLATRIRAKYSSKLELGKRVDPTDFERFMYELFKSARSNQGEREVIKALIKDHAVEGSLGLMEMFWTVRLYCDHVEEGKLDYENQLSAAAGFSEQQVAQFRQAFVQADVDGSGALTEEEILLVFDDVVNLDESQAESLKKEIDRMGNHKNHIDFAGFLKLMGAVARGSGENTF